MLSTLTNALSDKLLPCMWSYLDRLNQVIYQDKHKLGQGNNFLHLKFILSTLTKYNV